MPEKPKYLPGTILACALVVLSTLLVYGPVRTHDFVGYDDDHYVTKNLVVREGITARGFAWAFRTTTAANWHPLTWLSHMADVEIFGMDPAGHHFVNVALHVLNALLLFLLLRHMTGRRTESAFVALLFAIHPLHVESVAWVAERKDLLCTGFWILAIRAYCRYAARPCVARYLPVPVLFAAALLAKPMPVTLPFLLLLLDYWPLCRMGRMEPGSPGSTGRYPPRPLSRLLLEKAPLFALSALAIVATLSAQAGAILPRGNLPFPLRLENAVWSYLAYLGKTVWPVGLAVYYPHPGDTLPASWVAGATVILLVLSAVAVAAGRRRHYLPVGWFWYLGTLVPVIGLVQVGGQSMADRYTYFPLVGIFVMAAWGVSDLAGAFPRWKPVAIAFAAAASVALAAAAREQVGHWRDTETLFRHAIRVTEGNFVAHTNLGAALASQGRTGEAIPHFEEALRINPPDVNAHNNLGVIRDDRGDAEGAIRHFREAIRWNPGDARAYANLGYTLARTGALEEAVVNYKKALDRKPDDPRTHVNLSAALEGLGRSGEAVAHLEEAVRIAPGDSDALVELGVALARQGRVEDAVRRYREALRLRPGDAQTHFNLGVAMLRTGDPGGAAERFRETLRIRPGYKKARVNLGIALAGAGQIREAIAAYEEALKEEPDDVKALNGMGVAMARTGDLEGGVVYFQRALRIRPDDPETLFNLHKARDLSRQERRDPGGPAVDPGGRRP